MEGSPSPDGKDEITRDAPIRVLLVDAHTFFRNGLRGMLKQADTAVDVVADASGVEEAVARAAEFQPDVVLMDLHMPGVSGAEATSNIREVAPGARIIVLSGSDDDDSILAAIGAGAAGYVVKGADISDIMRAVGSEPGALVLSAAIAAPLIARALDAHDERALARIQSDLLTPREVDVLRLLAEGKENNEIAEALVISPRTAKNHVASILAKLGIENRIQAAVIAVRSGLA